MRATIAAAFAAADPAGLIYFGFPDDEYDPEVNDLLRRLQAGNVLSPELLADVLIRWFHRAAPDHVEQLFELITHPPASELPT